MASLWAACAGGCAALRFLVMEIVNWHQLVAHTMYRSGTCKSEQCIALCLCGSKALCFAMPPIVALAIEVWSADAVDWHVSYHVLPIMLCIVRVKREVLVLYTLKDCGRAMGSGGDD